MRLEGFGILVKDMGTMPPATESWDQRNCCVADPEGNLAEIGSFVKGDASDVV